MVMVMLSLMLLMMLVRMLRGTTTTEPVVPYSGKCDCCRGRCSGRDGAARTEEFCFFAFKDPPSSKVGLYARQQQLQLPKVGNKRIYA